MRDNEFQDQVERIFDGIEDAIDALDDDLDVESGAGLLNVKLPNGTSLVFTRQVPSREIWIAAKSGGYHLQRTDMGWVCGTTGEGLDVLVNRVFSEQLERDVVMLDASRAKYLSD